MKRRRWSLLLGGVGVVLVVAAAALYLRYIRLPAGYVDPDTIPRAVLEARAREFRQRANRLASHVLSGEPFDVTFTDEGINAYITTILTRTGRAWFDHLHVPDEIEHVQLMFQPTVVVLFGRLERGCGTCVFSAALRVRVNRRGELEARVARVRGGRLPIPQSLVGRFLQAVESRPLPIRISTGHRARLRRIRLDAGTIRLVGGPVANDE